MKSYNILALDPAISTGYALATINPITQTADIYEYGFIELDTEDERDGAKAVEMMDKVEILIYKHNIKHVVVEDYFFSRKFATGSMLNAALRTAIHAKCVLMDIEYTILGISLWKKFINKRTTPTKEQKALYGKEPAKKIMTQQSLWEQFGFRFPNHSISQKTNKPIKFRYDIVDAVAQCVTHCILSERCNIDKITLSVEPAKDVKLASKAKLFIYNY